jgi:1-acyl-sn-glycerol-3-phosphate acyltransferase
VDPDRSYIVCPNHQSNADILALLLMLPVRFVWVIKKELLRIPIFGWGLGRTGAISLDRSKGKEALKRMKESAGVLNEGWSVLVYPEGTRTFDGKVQDFKRGAFVMAVHTGVPILPVSVNGAYKIMPRGTVHFRSGHMKLVLGRPIETEGLGEDDIPMLMDKTREAILENFDFDYDPFNGEYDD